MLFDRYKHKLSLKDSSSVDYDEYLKTETGKQEMKKVEARIAKLLQRNDQVFYKSPKIYGVKELSWCQSWRRIRKGAL